MDPKIIKLPCYGIEVILGSPDPENPGAYLSGSILSDLHDDVGPDDESYDAAIDAIESFIMSAACAGIDITTPAFIEAIETTVEAIGNNIG